MIDWVQYSLENSYMVDDFVVEVAIKSMIKVWP